LKISFASNLKKTDEDLLILPYWEGSKEAGCIKHPSVGIALKDFSGKQGEVLLSYGEEGRLLLLGLGKQGGATVESVRRAYAAAVKLAQSKKIKHIHLVFPKCKQKDKFFQAIAEAVLLTNYAFSYKKDSLKDKPIVLLSEATFIGLSKQPSLQELQVIVDGVNFVRDLVNRNADDKVPKMLAKIAKDLHPKIKTTVFDKKKLEEEKMGLLLAVGRASSHEPVLIQASYKGDPKSDQHIVLVGKGVTYDTGGLSLKPTDGMLGMKCDMAGAATVLGAIKTAAELGLKINLTVVVPSAENNMDADSYKLGDVYTSYSGKTVEINNTDAEGRLILADALAYTVDKLNPSLIVDFATLTGACVVALGEEIGGLFSNDDPLAEDLLRSSENTGEMLCRFPVYADYKEAFRSEIADLTNSGGRDAGAIKGALFLQEFIKETPWAHIDIAGPAFQAKPKHYNPMKGTGYALRLIVDFLMRRSAKK
jgi:leucyl aminopeptidase